MIHNLTLVAILILLSAPVGYFVDRLFSPVIDGIRERNIRTFILVITMTFGYASAYMALIIFPILRSVSQWLS